MGNLVIENNNIKFVLLINFFYFENIFYSRLDIANVSFAEN
jgi:hypothetical protein